MSIDGGRRSSGRRGRRGCAERRVAEAQQSISSAGSLVIFLLDQASPGAGADELRLQCGHEPVDHALDRHDGAAGLGGGAKR
jgi:hypothetical protein